MTDNVKAVDLPDGSVVANDFHAFIKTHPAKYSQWRGTTGGFYPNELVQKELYNGAAVLRVGY